MLLNKKSVLVSIFALMISQNAQAGTSDVAISSELFSPNPGDYREEFVTRAINSFRQTSGRAPTIGKELATQRQQIAAASRLANMFSGFIALDLDGDGHVTPQELAIVKGVAAESALMPLTRFDTDKDGKVSMDEWIAGNSAGENRNQDFGAFDRNVARYLEIDPNKDGSISLDEFRSVAGAVFDHFDVDKNGSVSADEVLEWKKVIRENRERKNSATGQEFLSGQKQNANSPIGPKTLSSKGQEQKQLKTAVEPLPAPKTSPSNTPKALAAFGLDASKCVFPALNDNEKLTVYSTYEGVKTTNINLGAETWIVDVNVSPGTEPLYVVLPSYAPVIWRFSGAVERVSKVVPTSLIRADNSGVGTGGSGVVGIDSSKVSFLESSECLKYFNGPVEEAKMRGLMADILGRQPDYKGSSYHTEKVVLPAMTVQEGQSVPPWSDEGLNVEDIDPKIVVSASPAKRFDILPGRRGIKQLLQNGFLEKIQGDQQSYRIIKTFSSFPTGLMGGLPLTFLLAPGVEKPSGSTGWACVIDEKTGKILSGSDFSPACR